MRNFKFYKEISGRWYVDLPEWKGDKSDLEMVGGADTMLDILAQGENEIYLTLSNTPFENSDSLLLNFICEDEPWRSSPQEGAFYDISHLKGVDYNLQIWLCDVTKFVFGEFPKKIFIA